jgi:hypothetical protein
MSTTSTARSAKPARPKAGVVLPPVRKARPTTAAPKLARAPATRTTSARTTSARTTAARKPAVAKAATVASAGLEPDAVIRAATGRSWAQWFRVLDRFDVEGAGHSATVRHLAEEHECPRWWRQRIAQAHAQLRGLREPVRRDLAANTSRTLSVAVEDLYRAWRGRGPSKWLAGARFKIQRANENRSLRLDWQDHTSVEVYFWSKGERRSQVNVMHRQLASAIEVAQMKQFWTRALDQLQALLE